MSFPERSFLDTQVLAFMEVGYIERFLFQRVIVPIFFYSLG